MATEYSVFEAPPEGFQPRFEAAGCVCEWEGNLLYLRRHPDKVQGDLWGMPAGKMEPGEDPLSCVVRELAEETGIVCPPEKMISVGPLYIRVAGKDHIFHIFTTLFEAMPSLNLALEENIEAHWAPFEAILTLPLVAGGIEALQFYKSTLDHTPLAKV